MNSKHQCKEQKDTKAFKYMDVTQKECEIGDKKANLQRTGEHNSPFESCGSIHGRATLKLTQCIASGLSHLHG